MEKNEENPTVEEFQKNMEEIGTEHKEFQKRMEKYGEKMQSVSEEDVEIAVEEAAKIVEEIEVVDKGFSVDVATLEDKLMRTLADMENLRKRTSKDMENARKYAITSFAQDMIGVLENLRRAEQSIPEDTENDMIKSISEGITMTSNELLNVFKKHGIKRIEPLGEKFNHDFHQAMVEIPDGENEAGTVVQVMQAGYVLKDRLLRPAMVGVAKALPAEAE